MVAAPSRTATSSESWGVEALVLSRTSGLHRYCRLSWHLGRLGCVTALEYRTDLMLGLCSTVLLQTSSLLLIGVVLSNFGRLDGWTLPALAMLLGLRSLAHGIFVTFFNSLRGIAGVIRNGEVDRMLLRPVNVLFQIGYGGKIEFRGVGDFLAGIGYVAYATKGMGLRWTPELAAVFVIIVVSGVLIEAAIYTMTGVLAFWTMQDTALRQVAWILHERFILYPVQIYGTVLRTVLTFVVPFAFINCYPAEIFLSASAVGVPQGLRPALGYLTPGVALACSLVAGAFWGWASRRYVSTGS